VDYFSCHVEVKKLITRTAASVVIILKSIFAHFEIPMTLVSDNGPQFDYREMTQFAEIYGFCHITSSPLYPQSNGQAERAVKLSNSYLRILLIRTWPCLVTEPSLYLSVS